jgi:uncharacterized membrane protein
MKLFKIISCLLLLLSSFSLCAQENNTVKMADNFYGEGKIYIVIAVMTIIFVGIIIYLIRLEKKINRLEKNNL